MKEAHLVAAFTILLLTGCHSSGFSRADAKRILNKNGVAPITLVTLSVPELTKLVKLQGGRITGIPDHRFLDLSTSKQCVPGDTDIRVQMGQYVLCVAVVNPNEVTWQEPGYLVTLQKPIKWSIVEITGISESQNENVEKTVEYTWQYDFSAYPTDIQDAIRAPVSTGKALFHLYDDGWRFVRYVN